MACFLIWVEADMAVFTANQKHQKNSSNRVFMIYALLSIIYFYKPLKKKKNMYLPDKTLRAGFMPYGHVLSAWFIVAIWGDIVCRVNN